MLFSARLPPAYSSSGMWNRSSVEDALQGWITRRLLQTSALLAVFDHAEKPVHGLPRLHLEGQPQTRCHANEAFTPGDIRLLIG